MQKQRDAFLVEARVWTGFVDASAGVAEGVGGWWLDSGKLSVG